MNKGTRFWTNANDPKRRKSADDQLKAINDVEVM